MHMSVSTYRGQRLSDPSDGSNSGSQEEHYELLTTEPSLWPLPSYLLTPIQGHQFEYANAQMV